MATRFNLPYRIFLDVWVSFLAFLLSYWVRFSLLRGFFPPAFAPLPWYLWYALEFAFLLLVYLLFSGFYELDPFFFNLKKNAVHYFHASTFALFSLTLVAFFLNTLDPSRVVLVLSWGLSFLFLVLKDGWLLPSYRREQWRVLFLSEDGEREEVQQKLLRMYPKMEVSRVSWAPLETLMERLEAGVVQHSPHLLLVVPGRDEARFAQVVRFAFQHHLPVKVTPPVAGFLFSTLSFEELGGIPLMSHRCLYASFAGKLFKGVVDYTVGGFLFLLSLPLFLLLSLLLFLEMPVSPLHFQMRVGKEGKPIYLWKFRTMVPAAEEMLKREPALAEKFQQEFKLKQDPRVTSFGRFLRKFSLDELPQLVNVLRGEMSLVGPRPVVPEELPRYAPYEDLFLSVKPGLTGLWQVSGRSDLSYEQRVRLDLYYIQNWTPWLDVKILFLTPVAVLSARGAY